MPLKQNRTAPAGPAHLHGNSTNTRRGPVHAYPHAPSHHSSLTTVRRTLHARAKCSTVQVEPGDSCATLATKCGISPAEFTKYNYEKGFCSKLMPNQHVCRTEGEIPDFSPKPSEDGSCFSFQVEENDNCGNLAAEFSLTREHLEDFNKNTWRLNGCELLFIDTVICLSEVAAPFPAPIANAICEINPCPLKSCCNTWGQCDITKDFCVDTNTGAPGTAEPSTYRYISNCGKDVKKGSGNGEIKIGYYQGYCLSRDCLYQDPRQIDISAYTHLYFAFGTLTAQFDVEVGDQLSTYMFNRSKTVKGAKRILSLGGWLSRPNPRLYRIMRDGIKAANRHTMATKIANLIKEHDLDGVDIDWEYPGAPDLPTFDPGTEEDCYGSLPIPGP
ncbi:glycoside hydrolase superfamily [Aspergillus tetrazonus]